VCVSEKLQPSNASKLNEQKVSEIALKVFLNKRGGIILHYIVNR
jgi:hypothetical protein